MADHVTDEMVEAAMRAYYRAYFDHSVVAYESLTKTRVHAAIAAALAAAPKPRPGTHPMMALSDEEWGCECGHEFVQGEWFLRHIAMPEDTYAMDAGAHAYDYIHECRDCATRYGRALLLPEVTP